jgi:glycosidase
MTALNNHIKLVKQAIVLLLTYPGMPIIFYGDEMGMEGETDPNCRKAMQWSMSGSSIEAFTRRMIDIRNTSLSLQKGSMMHLNIGNNMYSFMRKLDDEFILIIINPTDADAQLNIHLSDLCLETLPQTHDPSLVVCVRGHESTLIQGSIVNRTLNEVCIL